MATQPKVEENAQTADGDQGAKAEAVGWSIQNQYGKLKAHAEAYPYVWGSYILVYGVFGGWVTYRWRKLRNAETSLQKLQEELRKMVEAEQRELRNSATGAEKSANSASSTIKPPTSADKVKR